MFIDPVSTGYSRAVEGTKPETFHGYQGDIESVGELIRLWTSRHKRWMSPKFLAGESYGTLRGAALAEHLQSRHGMYLNGLMLISSVLDLSLDRLRRSSATTGRTRCTCRRTPRSRTTTASTAARSLKAVLAEAEEYAAARLPVGARPRRPAHRQGARRRRDASWRR